MRNSISSAVTDLTGRYPLEGVPATSAECVSLHGTQNFLAQNGFWLRRPDLKRRRSLVAAFPDVAAALTFLSSGQFRPRVAYAKRRLFLVHSWCTLVCKWREATQMRAPQVIQNKWMSVSTNRTGWIGKPPPRPRPSQIRPTNAKTIKRHTAKHELSLARDYWSTFPTFNGTKNAHGTLNFPHTCQITRA